MLLSCCVSVTSAVAQGTSVPPPPAAPSSDIPDILKPKTVPVAPGKAPGTVKPGTVPPPLGKAPGMLKPGVVPPPPGKAPGTLKPGTVPPPPGKAPGLLKPRAVPPPLPGRVNPSAVPPPLGGVPGMLMPKGLTPGVPPLVTPNMTDLVTGNSVGGIKLGMTVGEARRVAGPLKLQADQDVDGLPILLLTDEKGFDVELYYDYDDPKAPAKEDAMITSLISWGENSATAEGVKVGMRISEVEAIYGRVEEIYSGEEESGEWVTFESGPSGIYFGITSDALGDGGVYRDGETSTTIYASDAKIYTIEAMGRMVADEESIAGIKIGDTELELGKAIVTQNLGRMEKGEEWMSDAIGAKIQTLDFPDSGLSVDMMSYEGAPKSVMSINLYSPSTKQTGEGVGIGTVKAEAIQAYEKFITGTEEKGFFENEDAHLVGSIYGGLVIHFDQGKVSNLFLGALAE